MSDLIPSPALPFEPEEGHAPPPMRPEDWLAAQQAQSGLLARASASVGRLDATLAALSPDAQEGATRRLGLIEIEAMLWAEGTPLRREEVGRELMDARANTDLSAMRLARWGLRRLEGQGAFGDLRGFLGLYRSDASGLAEPLATRSVGAAFDEGAEEFLAAHAALAEVEPIARAPALRVAWRIADLSAPECLTEPACWTARDMAQGCEALKFVPLGRGGRKVWIDTGPPAERMRRQLEAVLQGTTEARRELRRISDWAARARRETAGIKGDNPARVIEVLAAHPLMTTAMVETATGISRDTAERLLARMQGMGLLREITGARRFRLWTAGG
ncbi:MAG TPA: helix-turn-helix domain-containing protein [Paracoccus sp. (in: a-proteobacteria)]|uniref:helix-turn-helix domain-containing protein n=1 Tax=Paracoccus sp. TaxID=267 RepID=UPI002BD1FFDB|nr:helix-turn-helix domain-containing protein [Paracoccus sp. (in: a-proteobacteria)]HWL57576.1 helix-turn-helix domain-containing protein [Paracoccus sp. (in: a-proteobacteria)]